MWDSHQGQINDVKHRFELISADILLIHATLSQSGPWAVLIKPHGIDRLSLRHMIEHNQSECTAPIIFAPENDGALRIFVEFQEFNTITIKDSSLLQKMDECIASLVNARAHSKLDANWATARLKWMKTTKIKLHSRCITDSINRSIWC